MDKYTKSELIQILNCYDEYIQSFYEDYYDIEVYPVCLNEFLDNEYQAMLDDGYTDYKKWLNNI